MRLGTIILSLMLLSGLVGCREKRTKRTSGKVQVIATLFPTYEFTRAVGGDKIDVRLLLPPGQEAHTYDPSPQDIVAIGKADLFVYTGKQMEPWVADISSSLGKDANIVDTSAGIELLTSPHRHDTHGHEGHHHELKDPHIWLDFGAVQKMVDTIAAALIKRDPANNDYYLKNAAEYNAKIAELDARTKAELAKCKYKTIISGGHFAFAYYARRYGLKYESPYEGFSPNAEPSPKAIAALIETLKTSGIKAVFYEEMLEPRVATVIAKETGAKLLLLHACHNVSRDEMSQGKTFLGIMEDNLTRLKEGLN